MWRFSQEGYLENELSNWKIKLVNISVEMIQLSWLRRGVRALAVMYQLTHLKFHKDLKESKIGSEYLED